MVSYSIKAVGLCHGVFMGQRQIAGLLEMSVDELETAACGFNHFTWFQEISDRRTGQDLYPLLRDKEVDVLAEWDELGLGRILFRTFGLWPSPATNHYGEYIRWASDFIASVPVQFYYDSTEGHPWGTGKVPEMIYSMDRNPTGRPFFRREAVEKQESAKLEIVYLLADGVFDISHAKARINNCSLS